MVLSIQSALPLCMHIVCCHDGSSIATHIYASRSIDFYPSLFIQSYCGHVFGVIKENGLGNRQLKWRMRFVLNRTERKVKMVIIATGAPSASVSAPKQKPSKMMYWISDTKIVVDLHSHIPVPVNPLKGTLTLFWQIISISIVNITSYCWFLVRFPFCTQTFDTFFLSFSVPFPIFKNHLRNK